MKKSVFVVLASSLVLSGCGGGSSSTDTVSPKGAHVDVNLPLEALYGPIVNLKGHSLLTVDVENAARQVAYVNSVVLSSLAKASGQTDDRFLELLTNSALTGTPLTVGNLGTLDVSFSIKNGGAGFVLTSASFDISIPDFPLIETVFKPEIFSYDAKDKAFKYEFTGEQTPTNVLYSHFEHGNTTFSYSENSQGDHHYVAEHLSARAVNLDITYVANTKEVKVSRHGGSASTGYYNSSEDTISGL
ncbi:hypothetical protein [Vibrio nigripulchritudo]|uniref:hypothetical protein n=1 Tax=Vibrio nigripulchritudo TaxID=28173 RepID=UPI0003B211A4|nr:hypothetical protein [Vibrio nigripulchritudo]CCN69061.1 exported hypothetical protein [Vibrio nigripulchritudo SFn118]